MDSDNHCVTMDSDNHCIIVDSDIQPITMDSGYVIHINPFLALVMTVDYQYQKTTHRLSFLNEHLVNKVETTAMTQSSLLSK